MLIFIFIIYFLIISVWLIGIVEKRYNSLRDLFALILSIVIPFLIDFYKSNFIAYVICCVFAILIYNDVFDRFRFFIQWTQAGKKVVEIFDRIKNYFFKEELEDSSEILLAIILIVLVFIQIKFDTPVISLVDKSNLELLGFIVGIFSMYGIYIGFLQYLAGDVKADIYLGRSKVNYLIEKSFWYYATQSKLFVLMLLTTVIVPIAVKLDTVFISELTILWQTSYLILLVIYIFLLSRSLYIIRVEFLMKSNDDENLRNNMKKQIQQDYTETFWFIYRNRNSYQSDFIASKLNRDFSKLTENEYEEFIQNIFYRDYFDARNLSDSIFNYIKTGVKLSYTQKLRNKSWAKLRIFEERNWLDIYVEKNKCDLEDEWRNFYNYIRKFIFNKWNFLKQYQANFSPEVWLKLITEDLAIINQFLNHEKKRDIFRNRKNSRFVDN